MAKMFELNWEQMNFLKDQIKEGNELLYFSWNGNVLPVEIRNKNKKSNESNIVVNWMNGIKRIIEEGSSKQSNPSNVYNSVCSYCNAVITSLTSGKEE